MGGALFIFHGLWNNVSIVSFNSMIGSRSGTILCLSHADVKVRRSQLRFNVNLSRRVCPCRLWILVLHVLFGRVFVELPLSSYCHIGLLGPATFKLFRLLLIWTAHVGLICRHYWLGRNHGIIEVKISLLHLLFLFFQRLSSFPSYFMLDMRTLSIGLIISWNVLLPKLKVRFSNFFHLLFKLLLILSSSSIGVVSSVLDRFSSLFV